jgi:hypothetical protein
MEGWACDKPAKVFRDGKWFCGEHDPMRQIPGTMTEIERKAACFDELVAALEECLYSPPWSSNQNPNRVDHSIRADITARAALKKAKGEQS